MKTLIMAIGVDEKRSSDIMKEVGLTHKPTFRMNYIVPALRENILEMTIPEKPNSKLQKYRLTEKGKRLFKQLKMKENA
ncbi:MAG: hypothetical protein K9N06_10205 [Candidatus Cloacimonetes bacterium]|nr:hypothetical protein [Candidatus Cloacimonadota bacterium]